MKNVFAPVQCCTIIISIIIAIVLQRAKGPRIPLVSAHVRRERPCLYFIIFPLTKHKSHKYVNTKSPGALLAEPNSICLFKSWICSIRKRAFFRAIRAAKTGEERSLLSPAIRDNGRTKSRNWIARILCNYIAVSTALGDYPDVESAIQKTLPSSPKRWR